jgi:threonine dehydrogenase-like Zn-dependent dehydrogenase
LKIPAGFISGHEFVGIIDELGDEVTNFKVGDECVVPFFTACGNCFFCKKGESSRCPKGNLFGNSQGTISIDGGQAQYVRVPLADTTLVIAPKSIPREMLVLMADIFPTGYFGARRFLAGLRPDEAKESLSVVIGCGPVGCCAIASAKYLTRGATVFAVDSVEERLEEARKLGAIPLKPGDDAVEAVKKATEGRGADVVMEIVGHLDALQLAFKMVRPFGKISSIGVHTEEIPFQGFELYGKNVTMAFGRCPVRSLFEEALVVLEAVQDQIKFLVGKKMKLEEAPEAYKIFEQRKVSHDYGRGIC